MPNRKEVGAPPGTLVHVGRKKAQTVAIRQLFYNADDFEDIEIKNLDELKRAKKGMNSWINVSGIHEIGVIESIGNYFEIHPLVLEDILNTEQRPKLDEYDDYVFIVIKSISSFDPEIDHEQISIILMENLVITFQEGLENHLDGLMERLAKHQGRLRTHGSDYLAYAVLDTIVDKYFLLLDHYSSVIEGLEVKIIDSPSKDILSRIQKLKKQIADIRKTMYLNREIIGRFEKIDTRILDSSTLPYVRDVHDHTVQILESFDNYREILSGLLEIYLSNLSNKMNEVMKVLTIIATIFIPLSFIAGVFGMNFAHMPELGWKYSYPIALISMLIIALFMLRFFSKKEWI
ncbi:MAG: magnesium/cobalt transporter CorA [Candidatus Methanofastidiosa archaeon]|nr:magnesium/cobalt transporter CorA [Candidatus Methanofastidiosa archaeon]